MLKIWAIRLARMMSADGRGGMDGQRLAVEEVRGTTDDLELVDERPCCLFRFEVDGEDGTRQGAEL